MDVESLEKENDRGLDALAERVGLLKAVGRGTGWHGNGASTITEPSTHAGDAGNQGGGRHTPWYFRRHGKKYRP